jgi:hypothetical protein
LGFVRASKPFPLRSSNVDAEAGQQLADVFAGFATGGGFVVGVRDKNCGSVSPEWLKNNIGGVKRLIMVPRAKLFFPEEHPKLMSVLLQEFWRSIS